jgi:adenosylcobinamide amidohydrolase
MRDSIARGASFQAESFVVACARPFMTARFSQPQRTLGWSLLHPGFATVSDVVWVEVRNSDLTPNVDACAFLRGRLAQAGRPDALAFMTSRDIRNHHFRTRRVEDIEAACLTTVGLSNGERIGERKPARNWTGTINTLVHVARPLTDGAFVEALSIVAQARTAAILETRPASREKPITGTGTDCIVIAAPCSGEPLTCAGLHTALGEAIGAAVYDATLEGAEVWNAEFPADVRQEKDEHKSW